LRRRSVSRRNSPIRSRPQSRPRTISNRKGAWLPPPPPPPMEGSSTRICRQTNCPTKRESSIRNQ
jgi:hypothetical protein